MGVPRDHYDETRGQVILENEKLKSHVKFLQEQILRLEADVDVLLARVKTEQRRVADWKDKYYKAASPKSKREGLPYPDAKEKFNPKVEKGSD